MSFWEKNLQRIEGLVYALIILSIASIVLETHQGLSPEWHVGLKRFEFFTYIIFTLEYALRLGFAIRQGRVRAYAFSFFGLIDLMAILPFFLPYFISFDARAIRTLRLLRMVNLIKVVRHSKAVRTLVKVIQSIKTELGLTLFASLVLVLMAGMMMYYAEHETQPEVFNNMSQAIWWAIATLTTIGYGDIYPVTAIGKVLASLVALIGIGLIAIPTGLISAAYVEALKDDSQSADTKNEE
jgi:voltage-gated potassium channel